MDNERKVRAMSVDRRPDLVLLRSSDRAALNEYAPLYEPSQDPDGRGWFLLVRREHVVKELPSC